MIKDLIDIKSKKIKRSNLNMTDKKKKKMKMEKKGTNWWKHTGHRC